jgi:hypothetical protein
MSMSDQRRATWLPVLAPLLASLSSLLAGCAVPPSAVGASCPCPRVGYYCDKARGVCVAGSEPVDPPPPALHSCQTLGPNPVRALSVTEYRNSVADLLGVTLAPSELPAEVVGPTGFSNGPERIAGVQGLRQVAPLVVERARPAVASLLGCDRVARGDQACAQDFVDRFGRRIFRHPLDDDERSMLLAAHANGSSAGGFEAGILRVIETALGADAFLLRRDRGLPPKPGATLLDLTPFEIASRLSFLLWSSTPDDTLLTAAAAGGLDTRAGQRAQAQRLRADPRAERMLIEHHRQWLEIDAAAVGGGGDSLGYDPAMRSSVLRSAEDFVRQLVAKDDADLATLLGFPQLFADARMASFFDLASPTSPFDPVAPQAGQRRFGLLTLPARLAMRSLGDVPRPVVRGVWINARLLCAPLPPPPLGSMPPVPEPDPRRSTRQRYEQHGQSGCAVCHQRIDSMGFAFDNYDGLGRWRTSDGAYDVDTSGTMEDPDLRWQTTAELVPQLAASSQVRRCVTLQWFRQAFGRVETEADACTVEAIDRAFADGGYRTGALLQGIVTADAFTAAPLPP